MAGDVRGWYNADNRSRPMTRYLGCLVAVAFVVAPLLGLLA